MGLPLLRLRVADGDAGSRRARLRLRLVRVPLARHRRLSVDHHPGDDLRAEARLLPQRLRLRRQQRPDRLQGHPRLQRPVGRDPRRAVLAVGAGAGAELSRRPGDRRLEIRQGGDRHPRRREPRPLPRLPGRELQAVRLRRLGGDGGRRRRALRAAGRHHQPERVRSRQLDRGGDLGRGRRPRHAGRRGARRGGGQFRQDLFHRRLPRILALRARRPVRAGDPVPAQGADRPVEPAPRRQGDAAVDSVAGAAGGGRADERSGQARTHRLAALSRRRQRLLRRLQGAARPVADARAGRDARDHRPQRRRQDDDDGRHHRQDAARRGRRLFRGPPRPDAPRRGRNRRARRRPQVPEADGVREPHRRRQPAARRQGAARRVRDAVRRRRARRSARRSIGS